LLNTTESLLWPQPKSQMGVKKLLDFLAPKQKKAKTKKLRIVERVVKKESKQPSKEEVDRQKIEDKAKLQQLLGAINKKLQDPEMVKKASLILEKMVDKNK